MRHKECNSGSGRKIFEQILSLCLSGLEPDEKTVENLIEEYEQ